MNRLQTHKQLAIVSALVDGNSIRSIEHMTEVHRDTIMRRLVRIGENCQNLMDQHIQGIHSKYLQADEI